MTDRYEPMAPCPHCFESSGYEERVHHATWDEPAWSDADPCAPCWHCEGTGMVPASEVGPDDEREEDFYDDNYLAALDAQAARAVELAEAAMTHPIPSTNTRRVKDAYHPDDVPNVTRTVSRNDTPTQKAA